MYACLGVTCHLHFFAEWPGSFTCYFGNTGLERTPNKSQHSQLTLQKKILPPLLPGFELATDPGIKSGMSARANLYFKKKKERKKEAQAGNERSNILPKILTSEEKATTTTTTTNVQADVTVVLFQYL